MITELCHSDRLDESYTVLVDMKNRGTSPTYYTYNSILGCQSKAKKVTKALGLMRDMRLHTYMPWIKHYTSLVKNIFEHGKVLDGLNLLNEMV